MSSQFSEEEKYPHLSVFKNELRTVKVEFHTSRFETRSLHYTIFLYEVVSVEIIEDFWYDAISTTVATKFLFVNNN